jgi:hypothetical protein
MVRVLQIKCRARVSGEREREKCEDLERPVEGGEMTRVFLSRQSKNDPKRFSIGCILTIDKNFLLLLFSHNVR